MIAAEGEVRIDFGDALSCTKLDEDHPLTHAMSCVDFLVEFQDRIVFVEIKDPDCSKAQPKDIKKFVRKVEDGKLAVELARNGRDSVFYRACTCGLNKRIYYYVLLGMEGLSPAELQAQTDRLKSFLPLDQANGRECRQRLIEDCAVFNLRMWNAVFPFKAERII
jgi:hypothetical protein